jgi:hypothetical protein
MPIAIPDAHGFARNVIRGQSEIAGTDPGEAVSTRPRWSQSSGRPGVGLERAHL